MLEFYDNQETQHREVRFNGKLVHEIPRERVDDPDVGEVRPRWGQYTSNQASADF